MKIIIQTLLISSIFWTSTSVSSSEVEMLGLNASKEEIRDAFYGNGSRGIVGFSSEEKTENLSRGIGGFSSFEKTKKVTTNKYSKSKQKHSRPKVKTKLVTQKQYPKKNKINKKRYDSGVASAIQFKYNSAELLSGSKAFIRKTAEVLAESTVKFIIEGHTDASGDESLNYKLSEERANRIKYILITEYNISPDRISTVGKGESSLRFSPYDYKNRRVVIKILS